MVRIDGLVAMAELNGSEARVGGYDEAAGRYQLDLVGPSYRGDAHVSLKPGNVFAYAAAAAAKADLTAAAAGEGGVKREGTSRRKSPTASALSSSRAGYVVGKAADGEMSEGNAEGESPKQRRSSWKAVRTTGHAANAFKPVEPAPSTDALAA